MFKKLWKKTINSAVTFNNRFINNFRRGSEYTKINPENADNFTCTIEEQKYGNKRHTMFEKTLINLGSQVSITKKKNRVSSIL